MCRHLEDALSRNESVSARSQEKFGNQIDKVQEEMESVRACAVSVEVKVVRAPTMITDLHFIANAAYSTPIWRPVVASYRSHGNISCATRPPLQVLVHQYLHPRTDAHPETTCTNMHQHACIMYSFRWMPTFRVTT